MESSERYIRAHEDDEEFRRRLQRSWDVGFVGDISLIDGTEVSAVLIAISSSAVILDRWDRCTMAPAGDPFTVDIAAVREVGVP